MICDTTNQLVYNIMIHKFYFFSFKILFIIFFKRLITLQYCIGFAIHQHASAMGVHVFPTLDIHTEETRIERDTCLNLSNGLVPCY